MTDMQAGEFATLVCEDCGQTWDRHDDGRCPPRGDEIALTDDDEAALDRVWARRRQESEAAAAMLAAMMGLPLGAFGEDRNAGN